MNKFVNVVKDVGIKKGDYVIVMIFRLFEMYVIYMGLWKVGVIIILVFELFKVYDLEYCIYYVNVKVIVFYNGMIVEFDKIESIFFVLKKIIVGEKLFGWDYYEILMEVVLIEFECVEILCDDVCLFVFMSGIIGNFKGVVYIYGWGYVYICIVVDYWFDIYEDDIVWVIVGFGW